MSFNESSILKAHIAYSSDISAEIRIRNSHGLPHITLASVPAANQRQPHVKVERASRGCWRALLTELNLGEEYSVDIRDDSSSSVQLSFRTIDTTQDGGLGQLRLRIGVLADCHVNPYSYNGKRLYGSANELFSRYATKLVKKHKVHCLLLPGDVCDSGSPEELRLARDILHLIRQQVPVFAVIGNHERDPAAFARELVPQSPSTGYYSVDMNGVHLICLATDSQSSLERNTAQFKWLQEDLKSAASDSACQHIIVVMHYSLVLHPLHNNGEWDDGLQTLTNSQDIIDLLRSYPTVRAVVCGHKNVPSAVVTDGRLLHTLSPQLIQVPCAYDIMDIYDHGLTRCVHEIEETDLQDVSRRAAGDREASERWGKEEHRSFRFDFR